MHLHYELKSKKATLKINQRFRTAVYDKAWGYYNIHLQASTAPTTARTTAPTTGPSFGIDPVVANADANVTAVGPDEGTTEAFYDEAWGYLWRVSSVQIEN